jgi:phosphosulfolactate phosphohydrolase-like enzyme
MDIDGIQDALHELSMMVTVLLSAREDMLVPETNPSVFQIPRAAGEMLSFASYDLDKW